MRPFCGHELCRPLANELIRVGTNMRCGIISPKADLFVCHTTFALIFNSQGFARRWNNELGLKAEESYFSGIVGEKMCETNAKRSKLSRNRRNLAQITSVPQWFWTFRVTFAHFFIGKFFCEGFLPKSHQKDKQTVIVFTLECQLGTIAKTNVFDAHFQLRDTSLFDANFLLGHFAGQLLQIVVNCHSCRKLLQLS